MTPAAIYARKSPDEQQRGISEDAKSVTRQIEHAKAYAAKNGWAVPEEFIFEDDLISGAEFVRRPGFLRLMNALKPKPPFQVLIMSEESRLGREQIETSYALKQLTDAGVRVFLYLKDRELTLDTAMDKVMVSLTNFASETERERARQRTHDALQRKAERGHVTGGKVYGYRNVEVMSGDKRSHVKRVIVPEEAAVLVRIFRMVADGKGFVRIAKLFNAESLPSPGGRGWTASALRGMVYRDLYRGVSVWGRSRRIDRNGQTGKKAWVAESEWRIKAVPELRIIDDVLWNAAHERLQRTREAYIRTQGGRLWGRPESGVESPYLLVGFSLCGACSGSLFVQRRRYYGCTSHHLKGDRLCTNRLTMAMQVADAAVLEVLQQDILNPTAIALAIEQTVERYRARPGDIDQERATVEAELHRVETEIARLVNALASGDPLTSVQEAIRERERRRADLRAKLEHLDGLNRVPRLDKKALHDELGRRLEDWRGLLKAEPVKARQIMRKLLPTRLVFEPDPERLRYAFKGQASYGRLLTGAVKTERTRNLLRSA